MVGEKGGTTIKNQATPLQKANQDIVFMAIFMGLVPLLIVAGILCLLTH